jgi:serine/threonine protein kinase
MPNTSPPQSADARPPFEMLGSYHLLSKIGAGGMGSVYLARHVHLQRLVALKLLAPRHHDTPHVVARFRQEMEAIGRLRHRHIIGATDAGVENGCHYLVMEYVPGVDLGRLLRACGPFAVADACELARQTAEALLCIEQQGLVHRDLKPSNLLLGQDGVLRVLDLGLARLHEPSRGLEALTDSNQVMGTGDFIAPEQGLASHYVDIRADIYSLGCTLYALLAGAPPFAHPPFDNFYRKIRAHIEEPVPPILSRRPELPPGLSWLLDLMLAKDPAARVASPAEVVAGLERYTAGHDLAALLRRANAVAPAVPEDVALRPTTPERGQTRQGNEPTPSAPARRPARRFLLVGLCLGLLALGGAAWWVLPPWQPPPSPADRSPAANPPEPPRTDTLQPDVWHPLLDRPPRVLLWPENAKNSKLDYSPETHELWASCSGQGMLEFARVEGAAGFDLEMVFTQTPWSGGVGFFFRARENPAEPADRVWADLLSLNDFNGPPTDPVRLTRGTLGRLKGRKPSFSGTISSEPILRPRPNQEYRLAITVDAQGLRAVRWDGVAVGTKVCDGQPGMPRRSGAQGSVGLFLAGSNVLVHDARILIHPLAGDNP